MRVCLAQINTTPGDFEGNLRRIITGIDRANESACDVVLFPELTIPGYLSQDLVYNKGYVDRNLEVLDEVRDYSSRCHDRLHIVLGYIARNPGVGKPLFNNAAVISHGQVISTYTKQLLPFYDVFDELRYFQPGQALAIQEIAGRSVGIAICEDLWNDKGTDDYHYEGNPLSQYRDAGVEVILSLNSSPYVHGKAQRRIEVIGPGLEGVRLGPPGLGGGSRPVTGQSMAPDGTEDSPRSNFDGAMTVCYVNQRGGQDELVFDGRSFVLQGRRLLHLCDEVYEDSFDIVDLGAPDDPVNDEANGAVGSGQDGGEVMSYEARLFDLLVLCLRDYVHKSGFSEVVLASSGGVDSAVVCKIACAAVGAGNVHAIRMPSIFSSDHARGDAVALHRQLGCWDYEIPVMHEQVVAELNACYGVHGDELNLVRRTVSEGRYAAVADENIQARLRDVYLMHFSNAFGAMPLSTGNKTEAACGYYTHFDMNFSFAPIKDLYKFEVMDIARASPEIPDNIWRKPPSAELAPGQTDEASLLPYAVLDPIARAYVEEYISTFDGFRSWLHRVATREKITSDNAALKRWLMSPGAATDFERILSLIGRMEYKRRQTCPGPKVSKVAFGIGRRIPIVEKWS
ncbi:MAG: NAD(+) synthase [Proteobacteria bacterium]|nr:NAD(+) synthase [Pseudomonadota bacterium]